jgi:trans-aconitate methyltransferase
MATSTKAHWENVYTTKSEQQVSWYQPYAATAIQLLELLQLPLTANIIDIGGGDSHFADALLDKGYKNIWVLDISATAIEKAKARLGNKAAHVHWVVSDVLDFTPPVQFDLWFDRAAFHFLTTPEQITQYTTIAAHAVSPNSYMVTGTFSQNGPDRCSNLPVHKYSAETLTARFAPAFEKIRCHYEDHTTPFNTVQNFVFCVFKRI